MFCHRDSKIKHESPCVCLLPSVQPKHIVKPDYVGSRLVPEWPDYIEIKSQEQIHDLARACQLARHVLLLAGQSLKVIFALGMCGARKRKENKTVLTQCFSGWHDNR